MADNRMSGVKRLTPIVPGEMHPVIWIDGSVKTAFVGGAATEGRGFPQWAMDIFGKSGIAHFFGTADDCATSNSLCERVQKNVAYLYLPGTFPRCKECVRIRKLQERYR